MKVKLVPFAEPYAQDIVNIRTTVFLKEQKVAPEIDFDNQDQLAVHILIYQDNKAVGTARMLQDGHIGRVAILKPYRRCGLGSKVMAALISEARKKGYKRVFLGAQLSAIGFYEKMGFQMFGDEFIEAGIRHVEMELDL